MADPASFGNHERDLEQALLALKKGTQLLKYSRKGKPKFRAFRLSADEKTLIWYSHSEEKTLKLTTVSRIISGQRTAVFKRFLRPEKEYLSFSLIYKNGERSLDLICKEKAEVELWFSGIKSLISGQQRRRTRSDISDLQDADFCQFGRNFGPNFDINPDVTCGRDSVDLHTRESSFLASSDAGSERSNMQLRASGGDGFRISVSSTPSSSSGGSGPDDIESLGDVYVWGEIWSDGVIQDGSMSPISVKSEVLSPKPLESSVVLDVQQIACGVRHISLVTRQGEVFTWGEESGGRLGHGIDRDFSRPRLVEFLAVNNIDFVACGENHTCAVTTSGDLFTWGDGTHNVGLLGHGTEVSHWMPKRVTGSFEGLQVLSVACGTWHSAVATSSGKLFTFGDGTYGVLGHGDRESCLYPKEVQLLSGLKTLKVACGMWHTAAIVEVMGQNGSNMSSRKLFTWGDGDKHRLGHGNKEAYLLPTYVSSLIDYSFQQLACGHSMTVGLTTSGHVFTMGGTGHGQLGNPNSDGTLPCLVQERLVGEFVEEIACGTYHVAVLTSRSEVYTWGRGANGRLGHGDTEDRKTPTLVEALRDRHVKNVSCGSNFTACICLHKWVSGADQSICSGCRQAFGFTRKRHNCYHCGLVYCHSCSSKKALKASLAPTPGKPHRVCDSCYAKLKSAEAGNSSSAFRRLTAPRRSIDSRDRFDRGEARVSSILLSPTTEPVKYLEFQSGRPGTRAEETSIVRASQVPSLQQLKDIAFRNSLSALQNALKPVLQTSPPPSVTSRSSSPYSRKPSPPQSTTPVFSRSVIDSLKKSNEMLNQEMSKLQNQVKSLRQKSDLQDGEMQKLKKNVKETTSLAEDEASKSRSARGLLKSLTKHLKEVTEKLPAEISEKGDLKAIHAQAEAFLNTSTCSDITQNLFKENLTVLEDGEKTSSNMREDVPQSLGNAATDKSGRNEKQIIEQFEPGVYVTLAVLQNGSKVFKRVRFSKRRFDEHQAEDWWNKNKDRLLRKYNQSSPVTSTTLGAAPAGNPVQSNENKEATPSSSET